MKKWIRKQMDDQSKTMPILSFPAVWLLDINVRQLVNSSYYQAMAMQEISKNFPTSAALSMMDLSVEAEAFGSSIRFFDMDVPTVSASLIKNQREAKDLTVPKVGLKRDGIYIEGIRKASREIYDRPVFAGVIGPFSLAGRLMDMTEIMVNCYENPDMVHIILEKASEYITDYIIEFKKAGAGGVIMAEPAAGLLSPDLCQKYSSHYVKEIFSKVNDKDFILIYHNCGNVVPLISSIIDIDADAYHFGNCIDIYEMLKIIPKDKLVMGNIDPTLFTGENTEAITKVTTELLERCSSFPNFSISSGCDIPPASNWNNLKAYFDAIQSFSKEIFNKKIQSG